VSKVREYEITMSFGFLTEGEPTAQDILDYLNDLMSLEGPEGIEFGAKFIREKEV